MITTKGSKAFQTQRDREDNVLFITLVPKVLKLRVLVRWLNNLGDNKYDQ